MSFHENISATNFSNQDETLLYKRVVTLLQFDSQTPRLGNVVRADKESPFLTIIKLDDDRYITNHECSFKLALEVDG
jgi:hypothetical protein